MNEPPKHIPDQWIYGDMDLTGSEANKIIEDIMVIFIKNKITINTAKQILSDVISAIDKETIIETRKIQGEFIPYVR